MSSDKGANFTNKHAAGDQPDRIIADKIKIRAKDGCLPCAVAFDIAQEIGGSAAEVGKTLDLLNFRLVKCQLGLFGYGPGKKIVQPADSVAADLKTAIEAALVNGRLPCAGSWEIATRFKLRKMAVSNACEALGVKIKPCQLGAF
jgi:hypothetical protein